MLNVYCIPGMGVNARLFKNLKLDNCAIHHIKWKTIYKNESLADYAMRLSKNIDTTQPFVLLGVSFGGMCCVEIAKHLNPIKTFIISSAKTKKEIPFKMKIWKYLPLHKIISDNIFKKCAMLLKKEFGLFTNEQKTKFIEMLDTAPKNYFSGAINCILNWKNGTFPNNLIHIHGTSDKILPYKKSINYHYIINSGTHFMIIDKGEEISKILNTELQAVVY